MKKLTLTKEKIVLIEARTACHMLAIELDRRADNVTDEDRQSGKYGNLRHDAEVLWIAIRIFNQEVKRKTAIKQGVK